MKCAITVNGKQTSIAPQTSLQTLMRVLDQVSPAVTVTVNRLLIPQDDWGHAWLKDGDTVTIMQVIH